jgi:hypothetical protein
MADEKITELDADASPTIDDLLISVNAPGGTPANKKITIQNLLKLAPHWVGVGDPSAYHFTVGDFTTDGSWYDLDLSSIIPVGTQLIRLKAYVLGGAAGQHVQFRCNGYSNYVNTLIATTQVSGVPTHVHGIIPVDANRVIEYTGAAVAYTALSVAVLGWYIDTIN